MVRVTINLQLVQEWMDARQNMSREDTTALTWRQWMTEDWAVAYLQETHKQPRPSSTVTRKDSRPWAAVGHLEEVFSKQQVPLAILLSSSTILSNNLEVCPLAQACKPATQVRTTLSVTEGNTPLHTKETIADKAGIENDKK